MHVLAARGDEQEVEGADRDQDTIHQPSRTHLAALGPPESLEANEPQESQDGQGSRDHNEACPHEVEVVLNGSRGQMFKISVI